MRSFKLRNILAVGAMALFAAGGAAVATAQDRDRDDRHDRHDRNESNRQNNGNRWRVRRSGRYYNVDQNQAEILRQAVNQGYQQGYQAGREDRSGRRRSSYRNSRVYRSADFGYQSSVDRSLYSYYFQQGFQRGYEDGYSSRFRYGSNSDGGVSILGNILESILGLRQY